MERIRLDTHCMNDECIYTFLAKEIEVQHVELVQGKGKHKTPLQRLFERAEALYDKRKNTNTNCILWGNATVILKQIKMLPLCV